MQATVTGRQRINKYAPQNVFVGGKTGTYDGPNASPATVNLKSIRARNHVVNLKIGNKIYGLSILSNTGSGEDVAAQVRAMAPVLGGISGATKHTPTGGVKGGQRSFGPEDMWAEVVPAA